MVIKTDMTDRLNYARNQNAAAGSTQYRHNRMTAVEKTSLVYHKIWQRLAHTEHPLHTENVSVNSISAHHQTIMRYIMHDILIRLCVPARNMYHVRSNSGKLRLDKKLSYHRETARQLRICT